MNSLGFVIACLAGGANRHQQHVVEYLQEEVRVLKELHRGKRLCFSDEQRRRLAVKAKKLRFRRPSVIAGIVTRRTLLRWHRRLIANKYACTRTIKLETETGLKSLISNMCHFDSKGIKLETGGQCARAGQGRPDNKFGNAGPARPAERDTPWRSLRPSRGQSLAAQLRIRARRPD